MAGSKRTRRTRKLFLFDQPFLDQHGCIAGLDEAGCGPLAGPVVAAAVVLPTSCKLPRLDDSKKLSPEDRDILFPLISAVALAVGVGIIEADEIDRINIRQAGFAAMRQALESLTVFPKHLLIDGFRLPGVAHSQTRVVGGDARSSHIAAASIIAKVTRDRLMITWHEKFPVYGFKRHKGYGTREHLVALQKFGPSPIHRLTYAPVQAAKRLIPAFINE